MNFLDRKLCQETVPKSLASLISPARGGGISKEQDHKFRKSTEKTASLLQVWEERGLMREGKCSLLDVGANSWEIS